jgi:hypothetical protein
MRSLLPKPFKIAQLLVLLLTNGSQSSEAVDSEVELAALTYKKSIIIVELENIILKDAFTFCIHNKQIITVNKIAENADKIKKVIASVSTLTGKSVELTSLNTSDDNNANKKLVARIGNNMSLIKKLKDTDIDKENENDIKPYAFFCKYSSILE